jgi:hypothetical protein
MKTKKLKRISQSYFNSHKKLFHLRREIQIKYKKTAEPTILDVRNGSRKKDIRMK